MQYFSLIIFSSLVAAMNHDAFAETIFTQKEFSEAKAICESYDLKAHPEQAAGCYGRAAKNNPDSLEIKYFLGLANVYADNEPVVRKQYKILKNESPGLRFLLIDAIAHIQPEWLKLSFYQKELKDLGSDIKYAAPRPMVEISENEIEAVNDEFEEEIEFMNQLLEKCRPDVSIGKPMNQCRFGEIWQYDFLELGITNEKRSFYRMKRTADLISRYLSAAYENGPLVIKRGVWIESEVSWGKHIVYYYEIRKAFGDETVEVAAYLDAGQNGLQIDGAPAD